MPKKQHVRFIDLNRDQIRKRKDFLPRTRYMIEIISILFIIAAAIGLFIGSRNITFLNNYSFISLEISSLALVVALIIRSLRYDIECAEFLNVILSSMLGANCLFFLVVRSDGNAVHLSDALQKLYPQLGDSNNYQTAGIFSLLGLKEPEIEQLNGLITGHANKDVNASIMFDGKAKTVRLSVQALTRPAGYSTIIVYEK